VRTDFDLQLAARHIPGLKNGLSDGLSRFHYGKRDANDWRLHAPIHERAAAWVREQWGREFDIDAFADPTGRNAHCPRYWSAVDSFFDHDPAGMCLWGNPPFDRIEAVLRHFREAAGRDPHGTSAVFVLPEKTHDSWWRQTKGFSVLGRFQKGADLFTRPLLSSDGPATSRETVRGALWPVVLLYWAPARRCSGGGGSALPALPGANAFGLQPLQQLQLSGNGAYDYQRLRDLPPAPL